MDSYEKIRKMGEISKELKKHGLAEDSEEAMKKAEEIMVDGDSNVYVSQEKMKENIKKAEACCDNANDEIKRLQSAVNDRVSGMESQVNLIRDKLNEIIAKINELEQKIDAQPKQEVQATLVKEEQKAQENRDNSKVNPEVKKEYNPDDVAVDKMFYVGKK